MALSNGKSRQRMVRVPFLRDEYLQKKANSNPANKYNHVATEINALIEADYLEAQQKKKK